ncbi:MAG: hypothetical protein HY814_03540 [Candidatus Riflebacteria bacterium]|nr:hypothetical protein [Candidatus Riflebacteria bacterium]
MFAITGIALRPVWYNYCVPFNGVVIRAFNMRNGLTDECVTPKLTGRNGTFVLVQPDWSNGQAVRVGDVIRVSVTDPLNRLRRPLRCFPSEYTVEPWQVSQLNLRLNVLVY